MQGPSPQYITPTVRHAYNPFNVASQKSTCTSSSQNNPYTPLHLSKSPTPSVAPIAPPQKSTYNPIHIIFQQRKEKFIDIAVKNFSDTLSDNNYVQQLFISLCEAWFSDLDRKIFIQTLIKTYKKILLVQNDLMFRFLEIVLMFNGAIELLIDELRKDEGLYYVFDLCIKHVLNFIQSEWYTNLNSSIDVDIEYANNECAKEKIFTKRVLFRQPPITGLFSRIFPGYVNRATDNPILRPKLPEQIHTQDNLSLTKSDPLISQKSLQTIPQVDEPETPLQSMDLTENDGVSTLDEQELELEIFPKPELIPIGQIEFQFVQGEFTENRKKFLTDNQDLDLAFANQLMNYLDIFWDKDSSYEEREQVIFKLFAHRSFITQPSVYKALCHFPGALSLYLIKVFNHVLNLNRYTLEKHVLKKFFSAMQTVKAELGVDPNIYVEEDKQMLIRWAIFIDAVSKSFMEHLTTEDYKKLHPIYLEIAKCLSPHEKEVEQLQEVVASKFLALIEKRMRSIGVTLGREGLLGKEAQRFRFTNYKDLLEKLCQFLNLGASTGIKHIIASFIADIFSESILGRSFQKNLVDYPTEDFYTLVFSHSNDFIPFIISTWLDDDNFNLNPIVQVCVSQREGESKDQIFLKVLEMIQDHFHEYYIARKQTKIDLDLSKLYNQKEEFKQKAKDSVDAKNEIYGSILNQILCAIDLDYSKLKQNYEDLELESHFIAQGDDSIYPDTSDSSDQEVLKKQTVFHEHHLELTPAFTESMKAYFSTLWQEGNGQKLEEKKQVEKFIKRNSLKKIVSSQILKALLNFPRVAPQYLLSTFGGIVNSQNKVLLSTFYEVLKDFSEYANVDNLSLNFRFKADYNDCVRLIKAFHLIQPMIERYILNIDVQDYYRIYATLQRNGVRIENNPDYTQALFKTKEKDPVSRFRSKKLNVIRRYVFSTAATALNKKQKQKKALSITSTSGKKRRASSLLDKKRCKKKRSHMTSV